MSTNLLKNAFNLSDEYQVTDETIANLHYKFQHVIPYIILFTARSGSTFLTHELARTSCLGNPHEWFNWNYANRQHIEHSLSFEKYINNTIINEISGNNIFGLEINWPQLNFLLALLNPQSIFNNSITWFFLRRRNLVAQSISNYIADKSTVFHSYELSDEKVHKIDAVPYNNEEISRYIKNFCSQETRIKQWLLDKQITPINIYYEDIVTNTIETTYLFKNVLKIKDMPHYNPSKDLNPIKKIGRQINIDFENKFRAENSLFLQKILTMRPPVLSLADII